MAKEDNIRGVEKIEIGLPGDGVVGTSLTEFKAVVLNSLSLAFIQASETALSVQQYILSIFISLFMASVTHTNYQLT